jgi:SAM-dependent methyltransferase
MAIRLTDGESEAIHSTLFRLETRWHSPSVEQSPYHAWDSLPFWLFLDAIRVAAAHAPGRRFLDIGCGIGTKLALMFHLGYEVAGIDRRQDYIGAAHELVPEATLTCVDAFDVERFDADIVYMYRPAKSDELEDALEAHVCSRLRHDTVLVLPTRTIGHGLFKITAEVGVKV